MKPGKPGSRLTDAERQQIVELYQSNSSMRNIANELGRSYGSVNRVLVDSGVTIRARGGNRSKESAE